MYCANVTRTMFLEPHKAMEANYELLLAAHEAVVGAIKPGATFADAYDAGVAVIQVRCTVVLGTVTLDHLQSEFFRTKNRLSCLNSRNRSVS